MERSVRYHNIEFTDDIQERKGAVSSVGVIGHSEVVHVISHTPHIRGAQVNNFISYNKHL